MYRFNPQNSHHTDKAIHDLNTTHVSVQSRKINVDTPHNLGFKYNPCIGSIQVVLLILSMLLNLNTTHVSVQSVQITPSKSNE